MNEAVERAEDGKTADTLDTNQALQQSEERFRALVEYGSEIIMILDQEGSIRYSSPSGERILGHSAGSLIGESVYNYIYPGDLEAAYGLRESILGEPGKTLYFSCRARHVDGSWRYLESIARNLLDNPAIGGIVINARDVTERRRAEGQTARQLQRLQALRDIDLAILGSCDLHITLNVVLDQVTGMLGVDAAAFLMVNHYSQTLEYIAQRGLQGGLPQAPILRMGENAAGRAALERRLVMACDLIDAEEGIEIETIDPNIGCNPPGYYAVPLLAKGRANGVLEVFCKPSFTADTEWLGFLEALAGQAAIAIDNATLFDGLQHSNIELTLAYDATIEGWSRALDLRDKETEGHTQRVTEMTLRLARAMGLSDEELVHVRRGALLHDIGKMGVPDSILLKPDRLTLEEWEIMRRHTTYAFEMLSPIRFLRSAIDIPYCHHEKWDGTGYPRGLKGEVIPLAARIFAIVDVWDALRYDRPYRRALTDEEVRAYIRSQSGAHFDPVVVEAFLRLFPAS